MQIKDSMLHPMRNLENPIETFCDWVGVQPVSYADKNALILRMGFGGMHNPVVYF